MKKEKKDQFIALCADTLAEARQLMPFARSLSEAFRKGIILFTCSGDGDRWVGEVECPHVVLKGAWADAIEAMPVAFNVVLAIASCDSKAPRQALAHPKQLLKNFRQSKVAYLAVPADATDLCTDRVALTLDHQRESKEKLLWASYMARFCHSGIHVYHIPYTDADFRNRLNNNFRYLDKVFSSLSLQYEQHPLPGGSQYANPDLKALALGRCDLFISLVSDSRDRDFLDALLPPPPLRLLRSASATPVLFLNQRDDLYIMCD
ncbi:MAG: hypothetical protein IJ634_03445 [Bacteroidales bacterium]|nr:hypothetical protein [Bacteroidales bacterium]